MLIKLSPLSNTRFVTFDQQPDQIIFCNDVATIIGYHEIKSLMAHLYSPQKPNRIANLLESSDNNRKALVNKNYRCFVSTDFHPIGTIRDAVAREGVTRAKIDSYISPGRRRAPLHSLHPGSVHLRVAKDATAEIPPSETPVQDLLASKKPVELVQW